MPMPLSAEVLELTERISRETNPRRLRRLLEELCQRLEGREDNPVQAAALLAHRSPPPPALVELLKAAGIEK